MRVVGSECSARITISAMQQAAYERFLERTIPEYAREKVAAGNWPLEGSLERAREEYQKLLPNDLATPNHYLYSIERDGEEVGVIWLAALEDVDDGFILELYVSENARGQGVASAAMRALEGEAKRLGFKKLGLHVFGHNMIARRLYEKLGYAVTNVNMAKSLD
jgi:ribosomal protein S18 acetylase RimI-like enzyme